MEGYDNVRFCNQVSLFAKVEYIKCTMGNCVVPDKYALALGPQHKALVLVV